MEKVIEITGLTKKYGEQTVVSSLDLSIGKGEIFGLLGPNGAGKSTTILMLLGLTEPDSGRMKVGGMDPVKDPIRVKRRAGYLPEDVGFYDDLTGLDNLLYTARLNQIPGSEAMSRAESLLQRVGLEEEKHKKAGKYSRGMRQRLGLADVLIKHPEVIILDEPTQGIDPSGIKDFLELIVQLSREEGLTVLFSSHQLHQVQQVCDRVGIFVKGRLLAVGDIGSLSKQLFPESKMTVELELTGPGEPGSGPGSPDTSYADLQKALEQVGGVVQVRRDGNHFLVESDREVGPVISRIVLDSGFGLNHLNRKVYGLDEIYYRYFQGETNDQEEQPTATGE
jgi:ABC-2 type transport system ATP-binding protein